MQNRLTCSNLNAKGSLAFALVMPFLLAACQFGGSPDVPTSDDVDNAAKDQTSQVKSNAEGSQGGAVVGAHDDGSIDGSDNPNADMPNASDKTGIADLWLLDAVVMSDGSTLYDDADIRYYGTTYETVLAAEFSEADGERLFVCAFPGTDIIGEWEEQDETHASLSVPISDTETIGGSFVMDDNRQTAELHLDAFSESGETDEVTYILHRDDDTTITLDSMYETMVTNNDEFYNGLPVDVASDITFADDENLTMRLLGTTHADGMTGYLIEVTNKTDTPFIINDFYDEESFFTVNGTTQAKPLTGRVLPPMTVDEETGETMVAPMRCAIMFSNDSIGGSLNSAFGNLIVTDYHWNEVGRYQFTMNQ